LTRFIAVDVHAFLLRTAQPRPRIAQEFHYGDAAKHHRNEQENARPARQK